MWLFEIGISQKTIKIQPEMLHQEYHLSENDVVEDIFPEENPF